jgi:hypothetical protein
MGDNNFCLSPNIIIMMKQGELRGRLAGHVERMGIIYGILMGTPERKTPLESH